MRLFGPNGEPEPVSDTSPAILIGPVWPKPGVVMTNGAATAPAPVRSALRRVIRRDGMAVPLFDVLSMIAALAAEECVADVGIGGKGGSGTLARVAAIDQQIGPIRNCKCIERVLLNHDDGHALAMQRLDQAEQLGRGARRKAG